MRQIIDKWYRIELIKEKRKVENNIEKWLKKLNGIKSSYIGLNWVQAQLGVLHSRIQVELSFIL